MRVLWLTNFPLPSVQEELGLILNPKEGWLVQLSEEIAKREDISLSIASPCDEVDSVDERIVNKIKYYTYPKRYVRNKKISVFFENLKKESNPDIIHVQGSENPYGLHWIEVCGADKVVVSIQGMPSAIVRYVTGGFSKWTLWKHTTLGDVIRNSNIVIEQKEWIKRGIQEKKLLSSVKHIIGRTEWDRAHCWEINPKAEYHFCNETLRKSFYEHVWKYEECTPHTIFLPQATVALKGTHKVIEACSIVKKFFPDVKIIVPLCANISNASFYDRLKRRNYGAILNHWLKKYHLTNNFIVKGKLSEQQMLDEFLHCNVFISPSCIENSPNTLGEAQLLGVPSFASYVGGTDVIADYGKATELYRFEEIEVLAYKIVQLFQNGPDYDRLEYARQLALKRHDLTINLVTLVDIYKTI